MKLDLFLSKTALAVLVDHARLFESVLGAIFRKKNILPKMKSRTFPTQPIYLNYRGIFLSVSFHQTLSSKFIVTEHVY